MVLQIRESLLLLSSQSELFVVAEVVLEAAHTVAAHSWYSSSTGSVEHLDDTVIRSDVFPRW